MGGPATGESCEREDKEIAVLQETVSGKETKSKVNLSHLINHDFEVLERPVHSLSIIPIIPYSGLNLHYLTHATMSRTYFQSDL